MSKYNFHTVLFLSVLCLLASCSNRVLVNTQQGTVQDPNPNIPDNYAKLVSPDEPKTWGSYNVHDPSAIKVGDWYYVYSTDAVYGQQNSKAGIQIRRSKDLTHFEFVGWAFDGIPEVAMNGVMKANKGRKPENIWAPYVLKYKDDFRLYYSVSVFGSDASFIGMAESKTPTGPWVQKGKVMASSLHGGKNAIDPSVVINNETGEQWMAYGSCFGGIFMLQLNAETGLALKEGDEGHLIASRDGVTDKGCGKGLNGIDGVSNIEGPEIIYNPETKKYYLFLSFDWLFDTYNVRVGRADKPEGPYVDFEGKDMKLNTNHLPILTHSYRFNQHAGWQGVGHCGVLRDGNQYFMFNQARLASDPALMNLHVRKIEWDKNDWPSVQAERYVAFETVKLTDNDLVGKWEWMVLDANDLKLTTTNELVLLANHKLQNNANANWKIKNNLLTIQFENETQVLELKVTTCWDWELNKKSIAFTGLNSKGMSVWGKRISN